MMTTTENGKAALAPYSPARELPPDTLIVKPAITADFQANRFDHRPIGLALIGNEPVLINRHRTVGVERLPGGLVEMTLTFYAKSAEFTAAE